ncbi:DUF423 domain-containing protein [Coraliomargarita akajimensis]|uniref:DUF423 domain-containing protein n=1 Tax=Coraliomargarita akajimensis (strain DSM 45221 / IAM 15411 / JCM 23193 / KCTC 12865 / 04OKA010-24) TaxID=583355 RepID=D5ENF2_CORAD|nr:DUF423 domain-containing protein [Coraliomargarita akajimensis]ADE55428.1 protein of unknown function DUF423 [Coraliomargarita akajimensis DSM 45221]
MQTHSPFLQIGAGYGLLGVALGAFGAHGLEAQLIERDAVEIWQTAVSYQMWHALAIVLIALLQQNKVHKPAAGWSFTLGTAIFSGTLYGIGLGGPRWLGAITPIGGLLMLAGWLILCLPSKAETAPVE